MLLIIALLLSYVSSRQYIPYQAHGFNDIPYFMQQIKKGTTYFKFDLAAAERDSCEQYSLWNQTINQCELHSNGFEICCLAMRGDTSSLPVFRHQFNISNEFIQTLRNYPQYFSKSPAQGYEDKKVFAFNFQYEDKFTLLTKQILYDLAKVSEELNVDIVIGSSGFWNAYRDKCSTQECDDVEQYIANANFILQTTNNKYSEGQDKNFNTFYQNMDILCDQGWPEWVDEYGMIFWEPSHEYQVQYCKKLFYNQSCRISDRLRQVENLRLASNLEPENLQIFWKSPISTNEEYDTKQQKNIKYGHYQNPKTDFDSGCQNIFKGFENLNGITIEILTLKMQLIGQYFINQKQLKNLRIANDKLLIQTQNMLSIYQINCNELIHIHSQYIDESDYATITQDQFIILSLNSDKNQLQFYDAITGELNHELSIQLERLTQTQTLKLNFDSVYNNGIYHLAISFSKFEYILLDDEFKKIFTTLVVIDSQYNIISIDYAKAPISYGLVSDLKLVVQDEIVYIAQINTDGLCQAAILLNNNDWNKCQQEKYAEYSALTNVQYLMNYLWGKFTDVQKRIQDGVKVSGCDKDIIYSKIGNGANPSFALINYEEMYVLTEFVHFDKQGAFTQLFCGSSNDYLEGQEGLLEFTFDIVTPNNL